MKSLYIAVKYLKKRNKFFFSFSNMLSLLGIILGVVSILIVSSVMNGFREDMISNIIELKSEVKVFKEDYSKMDDIEFFNKKLKQVNGVKAIAPVTEIELILQKDNLIVSTITQGVDFEKYEKVTNLFDQVVLGDLSKGYLAEDEIIMGFDLALNVGVTVGEFITVSSPIAKRMTPFGMLPKVKKVRVAGILNAKFPEYNRIYSFMNINTVAYLSDLKEGEFKNLVIATENTEESKKIAKAVQKELGEKFEVQHWSQFESNLFHSMEMEKILMYVVLSLMTILASFNMTGNFIKLVVEKKSEIGILKVLGVEQKDIKRIFLSVGLIIGILGTFIGIVISLSFLLLQAKYHLVEIPLPAFALKWLPVKISVIDFIIVSAIVIFSSFLSTLYPIKKIDNIEPIKIIRDNEK